RGGAMSKARFTDSWDDSNGAGEALQFAVARLLLASAGCRMVRHQQFDQSTTRRLHLIGRGLHRHAGFDLTDAGSRIHTLADIHYAYAAYAHGVFVLLVAERWDGNPVDAGCIEDS